MANINLLPWREERREEKKREFFGWLLGAIILGIVISMLWNTWKKHELDSRVETNTFLQKEIDVLTKETEKLNGLRKSRDSLLARVEVIQDLQGKRPKIVHVFDELTKIIPEGVFLTSFTREGDTLSILGAAEANSDVSGFLRNIAGSSWFSEPDFQYVKAQSSMGEGVNEFSLKVNILAPDVAATKQANAQSANSHIIAPPLPQNDTVETSSTVGIAEQISVEKTQEEPPVVSESEALPVEEKIEYTDTPATDVQ